MKLTKEHIGKKVREHSWIRGEYLLIEWLDGDYFAGRTETGEPFAEKIKSSAYGWDWELVPDTKKPGQRVFDVCDLAFTPVDWISAQDQLKRAIREICVILDEQHESTKGEK